MTCNGFEMYYRSRMPFEKRKHVLLHLGIGYLGRLFNLGFKSPARDGISAVLRIPCLLLRNERCGLISLLRGNDVIG